jgi:hypothetical protein
MVSVYTIRHASRLLILHRLFRSTVTPIVIGSITEFYDSGKDLLLDTRNVVGSDTMILPGDDEVVATIKEILNSRIRPAVQV